MKFLIVSAVLLLVVVFVGTPHAADVRQALSQGLVLLNAQKGDPGFCTITDATYVKVDDKTSEAYVDLIQEQTGCTVGKGNLLFFHRPVDYPLMIALFRRETGDCAVISYDGKELKTGKTHMGLETVTKPEFWMAPNPLLGPDAFTIVSFAHAWKAGAPYDLLKCAEFHNHFCPAIAAGYMIATYILKTYPLGEGDAYTWIASPPWCKEEAIQVLLDLTPGKRNLYAKGLTEAQKENLTFENAAGILLISHANQIQSKAVAFAFDWNKVRKDDKLEMALGTIVYIETPEELVSIVKEVEVTPDVVHRLTMAETNPYKWLGLTK